MSDVNATLPEVVVTAKAPTPPIPQPPPQTQPSQLPALQIFVKRKIDVTIQVGPGEIFDTGTQTIKLSGLRVSADISETGNLQAQAHVQIWGMTRSQMNQVATLGIQIGAVLGRTIIIEAGDDTNGMTKIFTGDITDAFMDGRSMPDVSFQIAATTTGIDNVTPIPVTTLPGPQNAVDMLADFAKQMHLTFVNQGVQGIFINDPYLAGTLAEQAKNLAKYVNINMMITNDQMILEPPTQQSLVEIGPLSGLIGFPSYASNAIELTAVFNPQVTVYSDIVVNTSLEPAKGQWRVIERALELVSETPDAPWFMHVVATNHILRPDIVPTSATPYAGSPVRSTRAAAAGSAASYTALGSPASGQHGYVGFRPPTLTSEHNSIEFLIGKLINKMATAAMVKVVSVSNNGEVAPVGTVSVQILVSQVDGEGNGTKHGVIYNVPYMRVQGGTNAIIMDPKVGDIGVCVFASRDISTAKKTRAVSLPASSRRYAYSDGLYIGHVLNGTPQQYVRCYDQGVDIVSPGTINVQAPTVVITANNARLTEAGTLYLQGDVINGQGTALGTHIHSGVQGGPGNTGQPVPGSRAADAEGTGE